MKESIVRLQKRQPIPKRVSGDGSAPPRFLVAVNFALQAACFRNPPVLLRYVSSSQKIFALQIFFGSPVCLVFRVVLVVFSVACAWLRRAKRAALVYAKHTPRCQRIFDIIIENDVAC